MIGFTREPELRPRVSDFAALPPHMAESLRLSGQLKYDPSRVYASKTGGVASIKVK